MPAKLKEKDIDEFLLKVGLIRTGVFVNTNTKINLKCIAHNHEINRTIDSIKNSIKINKNNIGCSTCSIINCLKNKKPSINLIYQKNIEIDLYLKDKNIKRNGSYVDSNTKIEWTCLVDNCGYVWNALPYNIIHSNNGCPKCSNHLPLSNNDVDNRLSGRLLVRLDDVNGSKSKIRFKCLKENCHYIWFAQPAHIINAKRGGCPKCKNRIPLNNHIIDERLIGRDIACVDEYVNIHFPISFKCLKEKCQYVWKTTPNSVVNRGTGCPKCSGLLPLTNEKIDERLLDRKIIRIGNYINNITKINWQCDKCKFIWAATAESVLNAMSGCPKCLRKNQKIIFDILEKFKINFKFDYHLYKIINFEKSKFRVDFYLPNDNLIIEYNGAQHYQPTDFGFNNEEEKYINFERQKNRDLYVNSFCENNGIKILWIDGRKYYGNKLINFMEKIMEKLNEK